MNTLHKLEPVYGYSVQCSAVQCSAVQCSAVQCSAVQCSAVQCSAVQCSAVQCSAVHVTVHVAHACMHTLYVWSQDFLLTYKLINPLHLKKNLFYMPENWPHCTIV